ncbi:MAG: TonB-dependent receptor plug domain-containing protein, partial [Solimonas sp.]
MNSTQEPRHSARKSLLLAGALALLPQHGRAQSGALEPAPAPTPATADGGMPPPANAPETTPDDDMAEVVVTAGKRAQHLKQVPGSVAAFTGDALEKMGAQGMKDYLKAVPGVIFNDTGPDTSLPVIRGIATATINSDLPPIPTGVFIDDMPVTDFFGGSTLPDINPFDLERVEVLKGPQGPLVGSAALAGGIRYLTQKPDLGESKAKL